MPACSASTVRGEEASSESSIGADEVAAATSSGLANGTGAASEGPSDDGALQGGDTSRLGGSMSLIARRMRGTASRGTHWSGGSALALHARAHSEARGAAMRDSLMRDSLGRESEQREAGKTEGAEHVCGVEGAREGSGRALQHESGQAAARAQI